MPYFIIPLVLLVLAIVIMIQAIRVVRQQQVAIVERLGKFKRTLDPGPHLLAPFIDTVRYTLDMREMVVPFPPQGVITEDNRSSCSWPPRTSSTRSISRRSA